MQFTACRSLAECVRDEHSLLSRIGNTPLIRIRNIHPDAGPVRVFAKAEWLNPGGSVKDRPALQMLLAGEREGRLTRGRTIIDATSGNTGIAYAMIARCAGYRVLLALPANAGEERQRILRSYGAGLILTDPLEGTDGAQREVRRRVKEEPSEYFYPDQYNNPANWRAHYASTAEEIWRQTAGTITHFVAGLGTTGTFVGTSRRLKELDPEIRCIGVQPEEAMHGIEGLKHLATALVPGIYDPLAADDMMFVRTDEAAAMAKRLAMEEGLFVGTSSGAAMTACLRLSDSIRQGVIVTVFPDGGEKYLSEQFRING